MSKLTSIVIIILGIIVMTVLSLGYFLPYEDLAREQVAKQLETRNLKLKELRFKEIGFSGIEIETFALEDDLLVINNLKVGYSLSSLMNKSIESLSIGGISLRQKELMEKLKQAQNKKATKSKKETSQKMSLDEMVELVPLDRFDIGLTNLNGLHPELVANDFPLQLTFSKAKKRLVVQIKKGKIERFAESIKNFKLTSNLIFEVREGKLQLRIALFEGELGQNKILLPTDKIAEASGVLDMDHPFYFSSLKGTVPLFWRALQEEPYLTSLNLDLKFSLEGEQLNWDLDLHHMTDSLVGKIEGNLSLPKLDQGLIKTSASLKDLDKDNLSFFSPFLTQYIEKLDGSMELSGEITVKDKNYRPRLKLQGKGLGFQWEETKVKELNFTQTLGSFKSFRSLTTNTLSIDEIKMGAEITNLQAKYFVKNKNLIDLKQLELETYDGKIFFSPCKIVKNIPQNLVVEMKEFPLKKFLEMGLKDGVEATGNIEGKLPITFVGTTPLIKNGVLKNSGKGIIKYQPNAANPLKSVDAPQVNILLEYLQDFSYDQIEAKANSDKNYELELKTSFQGKNPGKSQPLKLGFNLDLNIIDSIRASLYFMKIPKLLEEKLVKKLESGN